MWPNVDAGSKDVAKGIRKFREDKADKTFFFIKNLSPENYARLLIIVFVVWVIHLLY